MVLNEDRRLSKECLLLVLPFGNTAHLEMNKETGLYPLSYKQTEKKRMVWYNNIVPTVEEESYVGHPHIHITF
jgi:hypothetical protein